MKMRSRNLDSGPGAAMRNAILVALVAGLFLSACRDQPAAAPTSQTHASTDPQASSALRDKIIPLLSGYESIVTKAELERLANPAALVEALVAIHKDAHLHKAIRLNALAGLGYFPGPQSKALLESVLLAADSPPLFVRSALRPYGSGFKDEAVPVLAKFLDHAELHTRNSAVRALTGIGTPVALAPLRRRLPDEPEPMIKARIEAAVSQPRRAQ